MQASPIPRDLRTLGVPAFYLPRLILALRRLAGLLEPAKGRAEVGVGLTRHKLQRSSTESGLPPRPGQTPLRRLGRPLDGVDGLAEVAGRPRPPSAPLALHGEGSLSRPTESVTLPFTFKSA